jgi:anti-sigma28 factor (negative regulator of flagellin synthesis)
MTYEIKKQNPTELKIQSIRLRIENGTYKIDAGDLADAILRSMEQQNIARGKGQAA